MTLTGRIHSFESFGTLDGPGIRFIVFMQGCPLRCLYCHNRDTWDPKGGNEFTVDQVFQKVESYRNFFAYSGGGLTVSGGEPTLQAEFVTELFKRCHASGIHTALDTSGFVEIGRVKELLKFTDLILLDIKHSEENKHLEITGVGSQKIKKFMHYTTQIGIPLWIRYVLIPGYTDSEETLKETAFLLCNMANVKKIEVLPYHSLGKYKWERLGENYKLNHVREPSAEDVHKASRILHDCLSLLNKKT
ncbi:MAG: pyruvate formate lyase-activating protein [Peptococcaceae bacterium]|jgi:pyruvate formate lyase activating enzyme|nr:pyruvate formate lyase-activating protein [Peptococcaceae bacterium]